MCQVGLQEGPDGENSSLVDRLMLNDSKLWKGDLLIASKGWCVKVGYFFFNLEMLINIFILFKIIIVVLDLGPNKYTKH